MADVSAAEPDRLEVQKKRQRMLEAVLAAFPTEELYPYAERSELYRGLVSSRPDPKLAEVQGMFTARWALLVRAWRRLLDERLRQHGQTLVRWHTLFELSVDEASETLTSLALRVGAMNPALVALLDELEKDGLIVRTVDQQDRRAKRITLTPAGEEAVTFMYDLAAQLRDEFLSGVSESELRLMLDAMERMKANLDRMNVAGREGP